jgi:hypothetical protein
MMKYEVKKLNSKAIDDWVMLMMVNDWDLSIILRFRSNKVDDEIYSLSFEFSH